MIVLAQELLEFAKKEFPDYDDLDYDNPNNSYRIGEMFWQSKNVEKYRSPIQIKRKIDKAEYLAQTEIRRRITEKEKEKLPSIISSCVIWAQEKRLKRITIGDVGVFLSEQAIKL